MTPEAISLVVSLEGVLKTIWLEATERSAFTVDDLFVLWGRLEALHGEIGDCLQGFTADREGNLRRLCDLEQRALEELDQVRATIALGAA